MKNVRFVGPQALHVCFHLLSKDCPVNVLQLGVEFQKLPLTFWTWYPCCNAAFSFRCSELWQVNGVLQVQLPFSLQRVERNMHSQKNEIQKQQHHDYYFKCFFISINFYLVSPQNDSGQVWLLSAGIFHPFTLVTDSK